MYKTWTEKPSYSETEDILFYVIRYVLNAIFFSVHLQRILHGMKKRFCQKTLRKLTGFSLT